MPLGDQSTGTLHSVFQCSHVIRTGDHRGSQTHAHAHTHCDTHTHTHIHTVTHTHAHTVTHTHTHTDTHAHVHTHTLFLSLSISLSLTHTHLFFFPMFVASSCDCTCKPSLRGLGRLFRRQLALPLIRQVLSTCHHHFHVPASLPLTMSINKRFPPHHG